MSKVIFTLGLFVLFGSAALSHTENRTTGRVRVGALLTLSGTFATAGSDCRNGIEAALAEIGDRARIQFAQTS